MNNSKSIILMLFTMIGMVSVMFFSCEKESVTPVSPSSSIKMKATDKPNENDPVLKAGDICGEVSERLIIDAEGNEVGKAKLFNDQDFFYVEMYGKAGFKFKTAVMDLAGEISGFPLDENGDPILRLFRYAIKNKKELPKVEMKVPLSELKDVMVVSTTAEVIKTNGPAEGVLTRVWIEGAVYGTNSSAMAFDYVKEACPDKSATTISEQKK